MNRTAMVHMQFHCENHYFGRSSVERMWWIAGKTAPIEHAKSSTDTLAVAELYDSSLIVRSLQVMQQPV